MFCAGEFLQVFPVNLPQSFETPKPPDAQIVRLRVVRHELRQLWRERSRVAIHDLLPRGAGLPGTGSVKVDQEILVRRLIKIRQVGAGGL